MSTRTSDRYPETLAKRSASSKASRVALVWRRWATVARRGRPTSTRGRSSGFHGLTSERDDDAARRQSATMPAVLTPMTTAKTLMPVRLVKFMVFRLQNPFWLLAYSAAQAWFSAGPSLRSETEPSRGCRSKYPLYRSSGFGDAVTRARRDSHLGMIAR